MSRNLEEVLQANAAYAEAFGDKGKLTSTPTRRIAVLTCMDARLVPAHFAGLHEGDAHIIRNGGGRASEDAIRSLVLSHKLLGTNEWYVIHHTGCGLMTIDDETVRELLADSLEPAVYAAGGWRNTVSGGGSTDARFINWLTFKDPLSCMMEDVVRLRNHPLVPASIPIYAYLYDVATGKLIEMPEAMEAGRARVRQ